MTNNSFSEIFDLIYTKQESQDFLIQLDELIESLFNVKESIDKKLNRFLPFDKKELILEFCRKNNVSLNNPESAQKFFEDLKTALKKISIINLEVACDLKGTHVKNISNWFLSNIGQKVILDIVINKELVGGAIVGFNGTSRNYSLKKKLEDSYARL